jgi:TolB protein
MSCRIFSLFFLLSLLPCKLALSGQEIRIHLLTETTLSPIYLSHIDMQNASFPPAYITEIEKILERDFQYNGKTTVASKTEQKDQKLKNSDIKDFSLPYALYFSLKGKELQCKVFQMKAANAKLLPPIFLSGSLKEDRRELHKLSDAIHKILFNSEGIASSHILYSFQSKNKDGGWTSEIAECDWDGENVRTITHENSYCVTPVSIPKGEGFLKNLFLYVSYKAGQPKIFIASREEGKGKKVVDIRGNQLLPAISRQRDQIAFICDASGRTDLFVQPLEPETGKTGTPVQLFSYPRSTQASPTFSPDGSKIAFVSDKDGATRIYWISSTPQGKRQAAHMLTKKNRENSCPCWSPDGSKLAYSAKTEGVRQIWIYDFTTGEEKQLTYGPGHKENPCWAANSLHIVFNSTDETYSDLYVVNLHQPEAVKITKGPGKKHYPSWGLR